MNRNKTLSLGEAFQEMLGDDSSLHEGLMEHRLLSSLPQLLPSISPYIGKADIRDSVLYLQIRSSVVKNQLTMGKAQLIRKLNDALHCELVRDIVLY